MAISYKIYRNSNPEGLGELVHEGDTLNVALTNQPHGRHYYKFTATNEYGTSRPSIAYEGVSVAPGGALNFANGIGKVTLNLEALTGADTLHLEGRNSDSDAWAEVYAGTNISHEFTSAGSMFAQWRYYGRYGADFKGDASPAAIYTAPTIGAATLSFTTAGGMVTFTYTGGEGAMIAELMSGTAVAGAFTNKSLTIPMPAANTTYHVRLRAGLVVASSNMLTIVITLNPIDVYFDDDNLEYTVPAGYTRCSYRICGDYDDMGGDILSTTIYKNHIAMNGIDGRDHCIDGEIPVAGGDIIGIRFDRASHGRKGEDASASITLIAPLQPINVDITNQTYTVPAGYTKCDYGLSVPYHEYQEYIVDLYLNNVQKATLSGSGRNITGSFAVKGGDILSAANSGDGYANISLT